MNTDTSLSDNQKPQFSQHLQSVFQMHREDLEILFRPWHELRIFSEKTKSEPYLDTMSSNCEQTTEAPLL